MSTYEISIHCPHCGKFTAVTPAPLKPVNPGNRTTETYFDGEHDGIGWWMGKCHSCHKPVLVYGNGHRILPSPRPGPVSEYIPEPMQTDLRDAKHCLAAGVFNAAVVMARRALQCAAVELGATKGEPLWKQVKWLDDNRKITPMQREWADAARWVGNHGAHDTEPDVASGTPVITDVAKEDAEDTIELVERLFESIYVAGRLAQRQLEKRGKA